MRGPMLTVTRLARTCGLSRSTVLYYESIGLIRPSRRTDGNYRVYSPAELERLRQIRAWRNSGLSLEDIRTLLDYGQGEAAAVLQRRLLQIEDEIAALREHQQSIRRLLMADGPAWRTKMTKDKWVKIMEAAGFSEEDMDRWHRQFERDAPEDHQKFLEFLEVPQTEIEKVREYSRKS